MPGTEQVPNSSAHQVHEPVLVVSVVAVAVEPAVALVVDALVVLVVLSGDNVVVLSRAAGADAVVGVDDVEVELD